MTVFLIDTREQRPIKFEKSLRVKLNVGDYTTHKHFNKLHIERKSPTDLYGTLLRGHARFRREINRAASSGTTLIVVVECTKKQFITYDWTGSQHCKVPLVTVKRIIKTVSERYNVKFVWCAGRLAMKKKIEQLLK